MEFVTNNDAYIGGRINNFKIAEDSMNLKIKLYDTVVLEFDKEFRKITLNSSGHKTRSTKEAIEYGSSRFGLGFQLSQTDYRWYILHKGQCYDFFDGMVLTDRGVFGKEPLTESDLKDREMRKNIRDWYLNNRSI